MSAATTSTSSSHVLCLSTSDSKYRSLQRSSSTLTKKVINWFRRIKSSEEQTRNLQKIGYMTSQRDLNTSVWWLFFTLTLACDRLPCDGVCIPEVGGLGQGGVVQPILEWSIRRSGGGRVGGWPVPVTLGISILCIEVHTMWNVMKYQVILRE